MKYILKLGLFYLEKDNAFRYQPIIPT